MSEPNESDNQSTPATNGTQKRTTLHPKDLIGLPSAQNLVEVIGAREVDNKFDPATPQLRLMLKGGGTAYVGGNSGIGKGIKNGKLRPSVATPLRLHATNTFVNGKAVPVWDLARRA